MGLLKIITINTILIIVFESCSASITSQITDRNNDTENMATDMLQNLAIEKMVSGFMESHRLLKKKWIVMLDDNFSHSLFNVQNMFYQRGSILNRLFISNAKFCYIFKQYNQQGLVSIQCTDLINGESNTDSSIVEESLFDTIDIYPDFFRNYFEIGKYHIKTTTKFDRVRIATHLARKVYFIGFKKHNDTYGDLYAVDLLKENNVDDSSVVKEADKIDFDWQLQDLTVDQYTGNLYVFADDLRVHVFSKIPHVKELDALYRSMQGKRAIQQSQSHTTVTQASTTIVDYEYEEDDDNDSYAE